MTFWGAFWALTLGVVLLEIVAVLTGVAGQREGLSTYVLAQWTGRHQRAPGRLSRPRRVESGMVAAMNEPGRCEPPPLALVGRATRARGTSPRRS